MHLNYLNATGMEYKLYNHHFPKYQQHSPNAENEGVCFDDLTLAVDGVVGGRVPVLVQLPQARGNVGGGKSHPDSNGSGSGFER